MRDQISLRVNGTSVEVHSGATVAVAVLLSGSPCRKSVTGEPRSPLCAMGICYECRVTINGERHRRGCQVLCASGMEVSTE
jgi:hypothetical protein